MHKFDQFFDFFHISNKTLFWPPSFAWAILFKGLRNLQFSLDHLKSINLWQIWGDKKRGGGGMGANRVYFGEFKHRELD